MKQTRIYLLTTEQFVHYWPEIKQMLQRIPHYYEMTTEENVLEAALKGAMQFWALSDGEIQCILVTEIRVCPLGKVFRYIGATGQNFDMFDSILEESFERVALTLGCQRVEVVATRRGWSKKLASMGFEFSHEVLSRDVRREKGH